MAKKPVSIGYKEVIMRSFAPGLYIDDLFDRLKKAIKDGSLFGEMGNCTFPLVPKDVFFEKCAKFMVHQISNSRSYVNTPLARTKENEVVQSMATDIYCNLDGIDYICIGLHRLKIVDPDGKSLCQMDDADLGCLFGFPQFGSGMAYKGALELCGEVLAGMYRDDTLQKYYYGTRQVFHFLSRGVIGIKDGDTMDSPYTIRFTGV